MLKRRLLISLGVTGLALPALAHHGFTGEYDWRKPVYLQGTIVFVSYGYPHAQIRLQLAAWQPPPAGLLAEVEASEGRATSSLLAAPRGSKPGQTLTAVFDPNMTRQLADAGAQAPRVGQMLQAVAYERISRDANSGELRALHVRLSDGKFLSGQRRSYHVEK